MSEFWEERFFCAGQLISFPPMRDLRWNALPFANREKKKHSQPRIKISFNFVRFFRIRYEHKNVIIIWYAHLLTPTVKLGGARRSSPCNIRIFMYSARSLSLIQCIRSIISPVFISLFKNRLFNFLLSFSCIFHSLVRLLVRSFIFVHFTRLIFRTQDYELKSYNTAICMNWFFQPNSRDLLIALRSVLLSNEIGAAEKWDHHFGQNKIIWMAFRHFRNFFLRVHLFNSWLHISTESKCAFIKCCASLGEHTDAMSDRNGWNALLWIARGTFGNRLSFVMHSSLTIAFVLENWIGGARYRNDGKTLPLSHLVCRMECRRTPRICIGIGVCVTSRYTAHRFTEKSTIDAP